MSGHSKWAQIKRQKGANDAKRGQLFTKLGREIMTAARQGGGDPDANFRLRLAVQKARENNMPADNIRRAIEKGSGSGEGGGLDEITYEGYGPGGTAILIEAMTDNRNRTVSEIRNVFTRAGGSLGESGSVAWQFESRGLLTIEANGADADELSLLAIDAGADDVNADEGTIEVLTPPDELDRVRRALEEQKARVTSAELTMIPKVRVSLGEKESLQTLKMIDRLEELDDVQRVHTNAEIADEVLEQYEG
jgi:YebC/PmpR family DNA-binding regulatory protein